MNIREKITQGEWRAFDLHHDGVYPGLELGYEEDYITIDVPKNISVSRANALAISKVPEMLELIERMVKYGEQWPIMTHYVTQIDSLVKDAKQLWEELNKEHLYNNDATSTH